MVLWRFIGGRRREIIVARPISHRFPPFSLRCNHIPGNDFDAESQNRMQNT